jgi:hypothetical protein
MDNPTFKSLVSFTLYSLAKDISPEDEFIVK